MEEKEKREKELLREIIKQAEEYKAEFYRRRKLACEHNKVANREKEKVIPKGGNTEVLDRLTLFYAAFGLLLVLGLWE